MSVPKYFNTLKTLLYAEKDLVEAEELALEAQNASKDLEYGDSSRLVDMYTNAQQLRIHNLYINRYLLRRVYHLTSHFLVHTSRIT